MLVFGRFALVASALSLAVSACGNADKPRAPGGNLNGGGVGEGGAGGTSSEGCVEGETAECKVVIHQASGVTSCWTGERACVNGAWSDCAVTQ